MMRTIRIPAEASRFQEDKELARELRAQQIMPALAAGHSVRLDFGDVVYATQSFIHALLAEALRKYGTDVLDRMEFHRCSPQVKSIVELVVSYSAAGFTAVPGKAEETAAAR